MLPAPLELYKYLFDRKFGHPSLTILQDKISEFFREMRGRETAAFPTFGCDLVWPSSDVIDVCLFGDVLKSLPVAKLWPESPGYRIWVLCHAMRDVVTEAFRLPRESVGVIPRYSLFPLPQKTVTPPELQTGKFTFVISSNYSQNKNIDLALGVIREFQRSSMASVMICGPRNEMELIEKIVRTYEWTIEPALLGNLGTDWASHPFENPVLVNFSTSLYEDFGVSIAQAQMNGFPLIISDWGGHKDILGPNVIKVPVAVTGMHIDPIEELPLRIRRTFDHIKGSTFGVSVGHVTTHPARIFSRQDLMEIGNVFTGSFGASIDEIYLQSQYDPGHPVAKMFLRHYY